MCASRNETVAPYWTVIGQVFWLCSHSAGWHFFLTEYRTVFSTFGKPLYVSCEEETTSNCKRCTCWWLALHGSVQLGYKQMCCSNQLDASLPDFEPAADNINNSGWYLSYLLLHHRFYHHLVASSISYLSFRGCSGAFCCRTSFKAAVGTLVGPQPSESSSRAVLSLSASHSCWQDLALPGLSGYGPLFLKPAC